VGLLHAAGEVDAACIAVVDAAGKVDAATPWDLGIPVGGASSDRLTGDVSLHAAGLADALSVCVHAGARVARNRWRHIIIIALLHQHSICVIKNRKHHPDMIQLIKPTL
jgi:hypothetical protein